MSELLKKSEENFSAAVLLIHKGFYAPSVHCSYYACFQKVKSLIAVAYNCNYDELRMEYDQIIRKKGNLKRIGSHEFFIDYKLQNLIKRNESDHRLLNKINDLKYFREKSDYDDIEINEEEAKRANENSALIIKQLNCLI